MDPMDERDDHDDEEDRERDAVAEKLAELEKRIATLELVAKFNWPLSHRKVV